MKKNLVKVFGLVLVLVVAVSCMVAFTACNKPDDTVKYDVIAATDLIQEDFGIAIKKGDTETKTAVDAVITEWLNNGNMTKYMDYYTALDKYEKDQGPKPEANGLKVTWNFTGTEELLMYTESGFAPYEFLNSKGQVEGLDVAIMSEAAEKLGMKLKVNDVAFESIPQMVQEATKKAVGAAGMTITEERQESFDFSNVYSSSTVVIVSKTGISSIKDLAGLKVGVQTGTSGDTIVTKADSAEGYVVNWGTEEEPDLKTVKADVQQVVQLKQYAMLKLQFESGQIDAIVMDKLPAELLFVGQIK